ncbi:MAG TPA: NUDIX domain-containing protein, partial [Sphingomicrobium sp.]|nr:NUDIX domain-containing protein [Sphingomicrobium sp.]
MSDEPIPAATLVVVRDRAAGPPELLMVERAPGMVFAGGALVFPGGRIDEADRQLARPLGYADGAARVAAIRETIEETAVAVGIEPLPAVDDALAMQGELVDDRPFAELLDDAGLGLDLDALTPFARWLPNFHVTRRFDTLFFIARAPAGDWQPNVMLGECSGAFWLTAADALERER